MEGNNASVNYLESQPEAQVLPHESHSSGVSWGAVIGGAFTAASLYLILLALGAGFGLSPVSPWSNEGMRASAVGAAAIVWLISIEIVSSGLGGYLTGRLRTKWASLHSDEVFFRDTANGFLAWAVAVVVSAAFLSSAAAVMAGNPAGFSARAENTATTAATGPNAYFVDALFRSTRAGEENTSQPEAARIFTNLLRANALQQNQTAAADQRYLAQLVAAKTGITQYEAEQRVTDVLNQARQAEDDARKAAAHLLLWMFLALLVGAFSASFAATIGGRQRDHVRAA